MGLPSQCGAKKNYEIASRGLANAVPRALGLAPCAEKNAENVGQGVIVAGTIVRV